MKYYLISVLAAVVDQISKKMVKSSLPTGKKKKIKGRLYLWHRKNKGLAYNKLENERNKVMAASAAGIAIAGSYLLFLVKRGAGGAEKLGPALILGGGLGNFIDRVRDKEVTDFIYIDKKNAPIFNVADITAVFGAVITIVSALIG